MLKLIRRLHYLFSQRRVEAELAEEIEFHRAHKQTRLEEAGVPPTEAAYSTRRALGVLVFPHTHDAPAILGEPSIRIGVPLPVRVDLRLPDEVLRREVRLRADAGVAEGELGRRPEDACEAARREVSTGTN